MNIASDVRNFCIQRETLVNRLLEQNNRKLSTIIAPAGYGKTTLMQQYLTASGDPFAVIRIPENTLFTQESFFKFLFNKISPCEFCRDTGFPKTLTFLSNCHEAGVDEVELMSDSINIFLEELAAGIEKHFTIAFDDLQYLDNPEWLESFLLAFLDLSSDKIRFLIASRIELPFNLISIISKRNIITVGVNDLIFSNREIEILARNTYDKELKKEETDLLNRLSGGWITGLHLCLQKFDILFSELVNKNTVPDSVFDYFTVIVFNKLNDEIKDYLLKTCFLDDFNADLTNNLLKIENSEEIIESIITRNVFVEKIFSPHKRQYKYIDLFRDFLVKTAENKLDDCMKKTLFKEFAVYFEKIKQNRRAIHFHLKAESYQPATKLLGNYCETIIKNSDYESALLWLEQIPKEIMVNEPVLLSVYGMVLYKYSGKYEQSKEILQRTIQLAKEKNNKKIEERAILDYLNVLIAESNQNGAISIIETALEKNHADDFKAKLLLQRATANLQLLRFADVRKDMQVVLNELDISDDRCMQRAYFNMAKSYSMEGNAWESLIWIDKIEEENISINTLIWKLYIQSLAGGLGDQIEIIFDSHKRLLEIETQYPANSLRKKTRVALTNAGFYADYEESMHSFNTLWQLSGTAGDYYLNSCLAAYYYVHLGQYRMAETEMHKAKSSAVEEHKAAWLYFLVAEAFIDLNNRKYNKAIQEFSKLVTLHKQFNMNYGVTTSYFYLIHCYIIAGQKRNALETLPLALESCIMYHYNTLFIILLCSFRNTLDFIIENTSDDSLFHTLYKNMYFIYEQPIISEGYRQRLDILMPQLPDIELHTFGTYELKIRGKVIGKEKWQINKWQDILVYFLVNHEHKPSKDNILELLSGGEYGKNLDNRFHQLLSNFRKVLKPKIQFDLKRHPNQVKVTPEYLVYEQQHLSLKGGFLYRIDVLEFQKLYEKGMDKNTDEKERINTLKQAIDLYKGEFLPGNYESWCEDIRMKFSWMADQILDELIAHYKTIQDYLELEMYCEKKIELDPYDEKVHLLSIESTIRRNKKKRAQKKIDRLQRMIEQDEIDISEEVQQKFDRFLAQIS